MCLTMQIDIVNRARATVESDKQLILGWIASDNNIPAFDAPGQAVPTQPPDAASSETAASGSTPGGAAGAARIERLNATLRLLFLLDPLDFSAELAAAAAYGEPAQPSTSSAGVKAAGTSTQGLPGWELQPVLEWCSDQGPGKTARLMAVWGALGSGKTTLAAALCKAVGRIKVRGGVGGPCMHLAPDSRALRYGDTVDCTEASAKATIADKP